MGTSPQQRTIQICIDDSSNKNIEGGDQPDVSETTLQTGLVKKGTAYKQQHLQES